LKSVFLAEGSGLGFHVAACKRGVFTHQCSSVLGKPTFSTESVDFCLSPPAAMGSGFNRSQKGDSKKQKGQQKGAKTANAISLSPSKAPLQSPSPRRKSRSLHHLRLPVLPMKPCP
jgi:hypothetical protein